MKLLTFLGWLPLEEPWLFKRSIWCWSCWLARGC